MSQPPLSDRWLGLRSWGLPGPFPHRVLTLLGRPELDLARDHKVLAIGAGRSYGDVGLNAGGIAIDSRLNDRLLGFDEATGILDCEAGVTLDTIVRVMLPRGWFPMVVPGTRFVTVGGMIANDVHGKNHHTAGSFGNHVVSLTLMSSDGAVVDCSRDHESARFRATIGGLGLTGLILSARVRLRRVVSAWMMARCRRFAGLDAFFELEREAADRYEYTVAWLDCPSAARGPVRLRLRAMAGQRSAQG